VLDLVLDVPYSLYDLHQKPKEEIDTVFKDLPILRSCLLALKDIWYVSDNVEKAKAVFKDYDALPKAVKRAILAYLRTAYREQKDFKAALTTIKGEDMIRIYNQDFIEAEERGEERGEKRGVKRGVKIGEERGEESKALKVAVKLIKRGAMSLEEIADTIEKDLSYVLSVKARIGRGEL